MWNAFGNGSGLHGGAGGGGGYMPAQGWEFVPCSRLGRERGMGRSCSPLRRVSSPPTVDLKKRHGKDKEEWMREKEILLRQVADIQGGENRRILLDLKSGLEEVQGEVKREEEKRSELQLQYTRDRYVWDLERAELKCRIAQLEARGSASALVVVGSVGAEVEQGGGVGPSETLRKDREEQRQLLADTHTAAMDLRYRLDLNERGWLKERSELLERFDSERREWESQLGDMQTKIEELYKEVTSRRKRGGNVQDVYQRFSLHSSNTGSSFLSEPSLSDPTTSSCQSDTHQRTNHSNSTSSNSCGLAGRNENSMNSAANGVVRSSPVERLDGQGRVPQGEESVGTLEVDISELEAILKGMMGQGPERDIMDKDNYRVQAPFSRSHSTDSSFNSSKKRNTTALNAALKEIAQVSEELCSYQDEIRMKAEDKRGNTEFQYLLEADQKGGDKDSTRLERDEMTFDLNQLYADLRVLEEQNWITWSDNTKDSWSTSSKKQKTNTTHPKQEKVAPPIPPRITSWYLSNPTPPEPEVQTQESHGLRKCHSPCVVVDRKSNSPYIVRKFEAMLQENEGKVLTDVGVASCSVPTNSNCNMGCCHNRWSCDGSLFGSSKSSTYVPIQKSLSEMNILTMGRDNHRLYDTAKSSEAQRLVMGQDSQYSLAIPSSNLAIVCPNTQGSRRNITLELKTAEFNRTLFQAEMGLGINEEDLTPAGISVDCEPICLTVGDEVTPRGAIVDLQPKRVEVKHQRGKPDILSVQSSGYALSSPPSHYPEVKLKRPSPDSRSQGRKVMEVTFDSSTSNVVSHDSNVSMSNIPSRNTRHREPVPVDLQVYCVSASPKQNKAQYGERPQQANAGSIAQASPETLLKQAGCRTQADTPRPCPRILNQHPWKPLTLAAYPRPADSRSNYGAVERILKSYESAAWAQQYQQSQPSLIQGPQPGLSQGGGDVIKPMDILEVDHLSLNPSCIKTQTPLTQTTTHRETLCVQESQETSSPESVQKTFSRPARPANRRLPSRWASHSPSPSSSPSPSTTPVTQSTVSAQKHTFSYSAYHTETVII